MPRRPFSLEEKLNIVSLLENGNKNIDVAKQYKTSPSTISTIWKHRQKWDNLKNVFVSKSKRARSSQYTALDDALLQWFKQQRALNIPINGPVLESKANDFAAKIKMDGFTCSNSWIQRFRERHGIIFGKISGESNSVDTAVCDDWLQNVWPKIRAGYADDDIFNADEAGIFYKLTPDKTFRFKDESCKGGKMSKDRLTVLVAANMSGGEKRRLLVIGKAKKPRCFKNVKSLPVFYENNAKAWMTSSIFEKTLLQWDTELRKKKPKNSIAR